MYATDPMSVRQLRSADLMAADQSRWAVSPVSHRRSWLRRKLFDRRPAPVETLHPAVATPSTASSALAPYHTLELFVGLDRNSLARLSESFVLIDVEPGHSLGRQGETSAEFVVVLEGRVGVSIDGLPLVVLDAGSHFGAIPLLDDGPTPYGRASFDVLEPSRVALAGRLEFARVLEQQPLVAGRIMAIADVRRAYLRGRADAAPAVEAASDEFPVHITDVR